MIPLRSTHHHHKRVMPLESVGTVSVLTSMTADARSGMRVAAFVRTSTTAGTDGEETAET